MKIRDYIREPKKKAPATRVMVSKAARDDLEAAINENLAQDDPNMFCTGGPLAHVALHTDHDWILRRAAYYIRNSQ